MRQFVRRRRKKKQNMNLQSSHLMLEIILLCLHDWRERIPLLHSPPRSCLTDFHPLVAFLIIILFFKHAAKRGFIFQLSSGEDLKKNKKIKSRPFLVNQVIGVNVAILFVGASFVFAAVLSGGRSSLLWRQAPLKNVFQVLLLHFHVHTRWCRMMCRVWHRRLLSHLSAAGVSPT